jgi:hypothetical protein
MQTYYQILGIAGVFLILLYITWFVKKFYNPNRWEKGNLLKVRLSWCEQGTWKNLSFVMPIEELQKLLNISQSKKLSVGEQAKQRSQ